MRAERRQFPLQVEPLEGESLESWLEATALGVGLTMGALAAVGGLPATARPSWRNWLSPTQAQALAEATGLSTSSLEAMTLSHYDGLALRLDPESHRLYSTFPFGPLSWSRFCPACIRETAGRWQLAWRLGWSFACMHHNCLLVDVCPKCGGHQRSTQLYRSSPSPSPASCRCGHPLGAVPTVRWASDHAFSWAQRTIDGFIDSGTNTFGVFREHPGQPPDALDAVRSLTNRVLNYASVRPLTIKGIVGDSTGGREVEFISSSARETLNAKAPQRAIDMAVGVTVALSVLRSPTISECGRAARWFIEGQNVTVGPAEIRSCARDSKVAAAIVLKARSDDMGPELQLRYRTATALACAPGLSREAVTEKAARLPAAIWSEWAFPLLSGRRPAGVLRATLSCATLLVGGRVKTVEAFRLLGIGQSSAISNQRLCALADTDSWDLLCQALTRLSDFLVQGGGRINYERRRRLDYAMLLDDESSLQQAAERTSLPMVVNLPRMRRLPRSGNSPVSRRLSMADNSPIAGISSVAARCYLIDRISGSPTLALSVYPDLDQRDLNALVTAFRAGLTQPAVTALDRVARQFLEQRGISEPVNWHPPLELLEGLYQ